MNLFKRAIYPRPGPDCPVYYCSHQLFPRLSPYNHFCKQQRSLCRIIRHAYLHCKPLPNSSAGGVLTYLIKVMCKDEATDEQVTAYVPE